MLTCTMVMMMTMMIHLVRGRQRHAFPCFFATTCNKKTMITTHQHTVNVVERSLRSINRQFATSLCHSIEAGILDDETDIQRRLRKDCTTLDRHQDDMNDTIYALSSGGGGASFSAGATAVFLAAAHSTYCVSFFRHIHCQ